MTTMVDAVVGYAQTENTESPRLPVDLSRTLDHAIESLRPDIVESGAEIIADELSTVLGDEPQLERLLVNLLGNAIKYAGTTPPRIRITATRERDQWQVSVADHGVGVESGSESRIFELFERGRPGRTVRPGTGKGIGLATCRRIVERHGGRIWVTPNEPRGSVFCFTLTDNFALGGPLRP
jgi:signal transduction histidine kinase